MAAYVQTPFARKFSFQNQTYSHRQQGQLNIELVDLVQGLVIPSDNNGCHEKMKQIMPQYNMVHDLIVREFQCSQYTKFICRPHKIVDLLQVGGSTK